MSRKLGGISFAAVGKEYFGKLLVVAVVLPVIYVFIRETVTPNIYGISLNQYRQVEKAK